MNRPSLLPPNTTPLERDLEQSMGMLEDVPVTLRTLWNPATCAAALLPWLAWAVSVDEWDPAWSEEQKRQVVATSFGVHQRKGTIGALKRAIEALNLPIYVREWFEYAGDPHTARLEIELLAGGLDQAAQESILRAAAKVKRLSTWITLRMAPIGSGPANYSGGIVLSETITINPA